MADLLVGVDDQDHDGFEAEQVADGNNGSRSDVRTKKIDLG